MTDPSPALDGRVAIVTGAGRGMGRAIATLLASEGAAVAVVDVDESAAASVAETIGAAGGRAIACVADVSRADAVARAVDRTTRELGTVDILVNNAGVLRPGPLERITEAEWDLVVDVTLKGAFLFIQAVAPIMRAQRRGRIVNIASMAGRATSTLGGAHYTAAKAGMLGLSRHAARELAAAGINVNAVSPGIIDTDMVRSNTSPDRLDQVIRTIPFKRLGLPQEVAQLVLFLVSDASAYITGAAVDIHGGEMIIQ
ncbi:MAG: SDR family oxidoreductase [Chloroflexi bacterium]|nr:SDR family oxidoreductase [Chloroflexota bacterium]